MSLDGVRKYYDVQRRLIELRLLALEAGREIRTLGIPQVTRMEGLRCLSMAMKGQNFPANPNPRLGSFAAAAIEPIPTSSTLPWRVRVYACHAA